MLSISLSIPGHKPAVAEYALRGFEAFHSFKERVIDTFVLRLLAFPIENAADNKGPEATLAEDIAKILV